MLRHHGVLPPPVLLPHISQATMTPFPLKLALDDLVSPIFKFRGGEADKRRVLGFSTTLKDGIYTYFCSTLQHMHKLPTHRLRARRYRNTGGLR